MPDPVIVPPTPTVRQGEPVDTSPGIETVQRIFDEKFPAIKVRPTEPSAPVDKSKETPAAPVTPTDQPPDKTKETPPAAAKEPSDESHKLPSFLEDVLKVEPVKPAAPAEDEWPEELPEFKDKKESSERYKRWRATYNNLKKELEAARSRPAQDEASLARLQTLEAQNKQMGEVLSRMGVETHVEFQQNILRPLYENWNQAASIVKESGGSPDELAKAMALTGKAQFEALDAIMEGMPETAKAEVREALRHYRHYSDLRQKALSEAPRTIQELRKKDLERQYEVLNQQRGEMKKLFEAARKQLQDAKIEVLTKSNNPETKWWDDQVDKISQEAEQLYMENTDLGKMAIAAWLAPMADVYRKLWIAERAAHAKSQKVMKDKFGSEPSLSESAGGDIHSTPDVKLQDDLKKPFTQVFLREFHRSQSQNRR